MVSIAEKAPGKEVAVEEASWRDLASLRHLESICFPKDVWPLLDLVGVLTLPSVVRLKAVVDHVMVGFVAGDIRSRKNFAWIATIGVLPEFRKRGIGKGLLRECESRLDVPLVRLCVRVSNEPAIRLYLNEGYHRAGLWSNYYQDSEDALVMEKRLP
jgi:ribosomal protein S18 acetylase RimI-like enzyme